MSSEISRMYGSAADAANAVEELREDGFDEIYVVSPPVGEQPPVSAIAAQIAQGRVWLEDAKVYAKGVAAGHTLVTVHAPFGSGRAITNILEAHNPVDSGIPASEPVTLWDEAAPLSSAMHWPTRIKDPIPASRVAGISPLTHSNWSFSGMIGLSLLSDSGKPMESRIGLPLLSDNPAPLSSMLGLPTIIQDRRSKW
jgi:hypothetical protein